MRADAVVVGAGPGGSSAAHALASAGASVVVLERSRFPRDKPCGGGVLVSALRQLPFDIAPVVEREIRGFRVRYRRGAEFSHRWERRLAVMTQRSRLDAFLAERAAEAGAELREGEAVRGIEIGGARDGGGGGESYVESHGAAVVRTAGGGLIRAGVVIAADGANGVCRRALGLPRLRAAVALEGNAPRSQAAAGRWTEHVGLELGSMPGGYGWVFPKGEHCNLGVGGYPIGARSLRGELAAYARSEGFDPDALEQLRAHHLPLRDAGQALTVGPAALVGDAAGLIDPLSGEGIGNAIRSGQLAAEAALGYLDGAASDLGAYEAGVLAEIEPELAAARELQALFHQRPWPYVQLLRRSGRFWGAFCRIVRGESSYDGLRSRLGSGQALLALAAGYAERGQRRRAGWQ